MLFARLSVSTAYIISKGRWIEYHHLLVGTPTCHFLLLSILVKYERPRLFPRKVADRHVD